MKNGWIVDLLNEDPAKLDAEIQDAGGIFPFFYGATPKDVHGNDELKKATKKFQKQAAEFAAFVNGLISGYPTYIGEDATVEDGVRD